MFGPSIRSEIALIAAQHRVEVVFVKAKGVVQVLGGALVTVEVERAMRTYQPILAQAVT
jgi:hypothetical protein